ncbi:MAG: DUF1674 domain-containing protein [Rickettsiales bacterium]|nr:DUF1674 domain-containing protein [Rickettsiales bacterium]
MTELDPKQTSDHQANTDDDNENTENDATERPEEIGGRDGPEPTRYGDWEVGGKCVDF